MGYTSKIVVEFACPVCGRKETTEQQIVPGEESDAIHYPHGWVTGSVGADTFSVCSLPCLVRRVNETFDKWMKMSEGSRAIVAALPFPSPVAIPPANTAPVDIKNL